MENFQLRLPVATYKIIETAEGFKFHTRWSNHNYMRFWEAIS